MISIGRRHIAFDSQVDLAKRGMRGGFQFKTHRGGWIKVRRFGRLVMMTLPRGKHV